MSDPQVDAHVPTEVPEKIRKLLTVDAGQDDRIRDIRSRLKRANIFHDRFTAAVGHLHSIHQGYMPGRSHADFLMLTGRSRSGKSTVLKYYAAQYAAEVVGTATRRPVVYLSLPPEVSLGAILSGMAAALGFPGMPFRKRDAALTFVQDHLKEQGVQLLIIDEIQQLTDHRTQRFAYVATEMFKDLLNRNLCQMVFAGMPSASAMLEVNQQSEGRNMARFEMEPYDWNDAGAGGRAAFLDLLATLGSILRAADFGGGVDFASEDVAWRFHVATDGLIGRATRLVSMASELAVRDRCKGIRMEHLAGAFDATRRPWMSQNPFRGGVPVRFERPVDWTDASEISGLRVRKRRKQTDPFTAR